MRGRWRLLLHVPDRELLEMVLDAALALRCQQDQLRRLSWLAGIPPGEVMASPCGARMIALGVMAGATHVHHELRAQVEWHGSIQPEGSVRDPLHGRWVGCALYSGKYQEFCAESNYAVYHPEHSSKWAPHEMLHRAVGSLVGDVPRFHRYLGARLNELLPVATFYGLEHVLRLDREGPFDRIREAEERDAPEEKALWLRESMASLRARAKRALPLVRWTLERVASELACIDREFEERRLHRSGSQPWQGINGVELEASSDALAYLRAHLKRLESPAMSTLLSQMPGPRWKSVEQLRAHVERVMDWLLFDPIEVDFNRAEWAIRANYPFELLFRIALIDPEFPVSTWISKARSLVQEGNLEDRVLVAFRNALAEALHERKPTIKEPEPLLRLGLPPNGPLGGIGDTDLKTLEKGLRQCFPESARRLGRKGQRRAVEGIVQAGPKRALLDARLIEWLEGQEDAEAKSLAELVRFEAALCTPKATDPRVQMGLALEEAPSSARVILRSEVSLLKTKVDVISAHQGEPLREGIHWVLAGLVEGVPVACALPPQIAEALSQPEPPTLGFLEQIGGREAIRELVQANLIVLFP
ncbi:MAG: hypothetical protein RMJ84_10105 [Sandaracinaceae bacterium]|nr:hypothetical protein [Sandaracinaceae bacterium]